MDYKAIEGVALNVMMQQVTPADKVNIIALQRAVAVAIAKALEEYDKQKG